ncbi:MAG: hypothetical protein WC695_00010 [Candidatus Omnitrophota bacterium]
MLRKLQGIALKLILFLVWFDLMCFTLILAGNVFKWSFFNESVGSAFFTTFGLSLGALAALAVLHVVLTLNIISNSISVAVQEKDLRTQEEVQKSKKRFKKYLVISIVGIVCIVGYQGIVERNAALHKVEKIKKQLSDVVRSTLAKRIVDLIEQDEKVNKLYFVRDEMLLSLEDQRSVTLLIPKTGQEGQVFYSVTPWDYDNKDETSIARSLKQLFVPNDDERKKFVQLVKSHLPFTVVGRMHIRAFYPIVKEGKLKVILLLDTSRMVSSEYLMSRSKF